MGIEKQPEVWGTNNATPFEAVLYYGSVLGGLSSLAYGFLFGNDGAVMCGVILFFASVIPTVTAYMRAQENMRLYGNVYGRKE